MPLEKIAALREDGEGGAGVRLPIPGFVKWFGGGGLPREAVKLKEAAGAVVEGEGVEVAFRRGEGEDKARIEAVGRGLALEELVQV
jgi:hypothetical protein